MTDYLLNIIDSLGYAGVALLMFLENIIPFIPSEVIMPAAGASAREGESSLLLEIIFGTIGTVLGTTCWYLAARAVGTERFREWIGKHGQWVGTSVKDVEKLDRWFEKHGIWAILLGRLVPGVRTLISVPAGFSEMPWKPFLLYTSIGSFIWTSFLAGVGYWLKGQSSAVADVISWIGVLVVAGLLVWFVVRIFRESVLSTGH